MPFESDQKINANDIVTIRAKVMSAGEQFVIVEVRRWNGEDFTSSRLTVDRKDIEVVEQIDWSVGDRFAVRGSYELGTVKALSDDRSKAWCLMASSGVYLTLALEMLGKTF